MRLIVLVLALLGAVCQLHGQNLIENGEFDLGPFTWVLGKSNGGQATFLVDNSGQLSGDNSAKIEITDGTKEAGNVSLFQGIELSSGATYSISFMAKVESNKVINVSIENDLMTIWETTIELKSGQMAYGPYYIESSISDFSTELKFNVGGDESTIYLDNVRFTKETLTPVAGGPDKINVIEFFPNPASNEMVIRFKRPIKQEAYLNIYSMDGRMVSTNLLDIGVDEEKIVLDGFSKGNYIAQLSSAGFSYTQKFVKK